jgi:glycosyltransferase involved in cell wall biosynthesis
VYRRDVLKKAGLFDLRFSPSQYDDPDHHIALAVQGYEILYDGRVGVVHALNSGAGQTFAAIANKNANQEKLFGKWGPEIWMILDRSLDESVEGRFLPNDGDISSYLATLPAPEAYPKKDTPAANDVTRDRIEKILRMRDYVLLADGPHKEYWDDFLSHGLGLRRDTFLRESAASLGSMIDLVPANVTAMAELATTYEAMGEPSKADLILRRAASLAPDDASLRERLARLAEKTLLGTAGPAAAEHVAPADRSREIGEAVLATVAASGRPKLRVLMVNTFERRTAGGDMHQVKKTKQAIEALGATVDVAYEPRPDPRGYDLVHVWNLWFPAQTLPQVRGIRVQAPDVPIALSPIYWDMSEKAWADGAIPAIFAHSTSDSELKEKLRHLASGVLSVNERRRSDRQEPNFGGYESYQKKIVGLVDHLLPNSEAEMRNMASILKVRPPYTVVRNAADPAVFDAASPDWFEREYGVKDFVLTVGLVEVRKNQLMLLHALADTDIPVVIIGRNYNRHYLRLCRRFAGKRHKTIFIEHLPHEMLASALKAARVFALPSWMECASFAIAEAALAGCPLVVSNRTSEPEYFGDSAYLCDPASVDSIREGVVQAYENRDADAPKRARLQELFRKEYTWRNVGLSTFEGYRKAFEARGRAFPGETPPVFTQTGGPEPVHA